jgi:molecular chaperone GrpE
MKKGRLPMEENKKDTAPETEAPKAEATPAGETTETEKKEKKDKKFFHKEQKELEAAKAQLAEKENQYLRLYAEYENFRKRSEKEKTDCYNTAYGDALTAFLPLIDSMTQALQFSPEDQGIKALAKQLSDILAKLNITEIESDGAQFDPNVHNAIMHEENPELGENVVTQTFQKGYKRGDKVLRCAMVKVAN